MLYSFLAEALPLAATWVIVVVGLRVLERVITHQLRSRRDRQHQVNALISEDSARRERLDELTRSALLSGVNTVDEELMNNIKLLAKARRMSRRELDEIATSQFGMGLKDLDNEDAESLIAVLESMKPR